MTERKHILSDDEFRRYEEIGKAVMSGAATEIVKYLIIILITVTSLNIADGIVTRYFALDVDDCDHDTWHRCGMDVFTDQASGRQYLATPNGGLVERDQVLRP